jgi:addiction module RelB/DinJ family antitoxin
MITKRGDIMSVQVSTRIDQATKQQFDSICEKLGVTPSNALSMFIRGVINHNGIPFNVVAPAELNMDKKSYRKMMFEKSIEEIDVYDEELGIRNMQDVVDLVKQVRRETKGAGEAK